MNIKIQNFQLKNEIKSPISKSCEQRILLISFLSGNKITLNKKNMPDDVISFNKVLQQISNKNIGNNTFNCGESAFAARTLPFILALYYSSFIITGEKTLIKRKIANDFDFLKKIGWQISYKNNSLPLEFENACLKNGIYVISNPETSQIVSGLLFVLPLLNGNSQIIVKNVVSCDYIYLTINILKEYGIQFFFDSSNNDLNIKIEGNQKYKSGKLAAEEGDWSGVAFFLVAAAISKTTYFSGLNKNSFQADKKILSVLDYANVKYYWNENNLIVEKSEIKAFDFDGTNCPDLIPAIFVLTLFANGKSRIYGTRRLLNKESSRAEVLFEEFSKIGAKIEINDNCMCVVGNQKYNSAVLNSHNDHRIAMSEIITAYLLNNDTEILNINCINKSYPDFLENLFKI